MMIGLLHQLCEPRQLIAELEDAAHQALVRPANRQPVTVRAPDRSERSLGRRRQAHLLDHELAEQLAEHIERGVGLVLEVHVEGALGDAGRRGDVGDPQCVIAPAIQHPGGGDAQALARALAFLLGRGRLQPRLEEADEGQRRAGGSRGAACSSAFRAHGLTRSKNEDKLNINKLSAPHRRTKFRCPNRKRQRRRPGPPRPPGPQAASCSRTGCA